MLKNSLYIKNEFDAESAAGEHLHGAGNLSG
jgi:hypothetical protein